MIRAAFIDFDGTLVDTINVYKEVNKIAFKEKFNIEVKDEDFLDFGSDPKDMIERIFIKYNIETNLGEFLRYRDSLFLNNIDKIKMHKGAKELILFLKENKIKIGIVTSSSKEIVNKILTNIGILNLFDIIVAREDVKNTKPDPEGYIKAYKSLNILPHECFAIEDSVYGVLAAKRAGIKVFAVLTGSNNRNQLKNMGAEKIFKDLKEAKKYIESLISEGKIEEKQG